MEVLVCLTETGIKKLKNWDIMRVQLVMPKFMKFQMHWVNSGEEFLMVRTRDHNFTIRVHMLDKQKKHNKFLRSDSKFYQ